MKFSTKHKIEKCCSKDSLRPVLHKVYFTGESMVATSGHILAEIPVVNDNESVPALIGSKALAEMNKQGGKCKEIELQVEKDSVKCQNLNNNAEISFPVDPDTGQYPNYKRVMPDSEVIFSVGIDAKLLLELSQALGDKDLVLSFHKKGFRDDKKYKSTAISARPMDNNGAKGLIMPMIIND